MQRVLLYLTRGDGTQKCCFCALPVSIHQMVRPCFTCPEATAHNACFVEWLRLDPRHVQCLVCGERYISLEVAQAEYLVRWSCATGLSALVHAAVCTFAL